MAIAFCVVCGIAAVLAHPSPELTVRVLYHRNSGCHGILQRRYCRSPERAGRLPRTTHGWPTANNFKTRQLDKAVQKPQDLSLVAGRTRPDAPAGTLCLYRDVQTAKRLSRRGLRASLGGVSLFVQKNTAWHGFGDGAVRKEHSNMSGSRRFQSAPFPGFSGPRDASSRERPEGHLNT